MAQGDAQLLVAGTATAPVDYVVPGAQEIEPLMVAALFDGSAAAGNFVPCVVLEGPGGVIAGRAPLDTTVTAGSSVYATWFPGVKSASGSSAGVSFHWAHVILGPSTPSGSVATPSTGTVMPIVSLATNTPADYFTVSASVWSAPIVEQQVYGHMLVDGGALTVLNGDVYIDVQNTSGFATGPFAGNGSRFLIGYYSDFTADLGIVGNGWHVFCAGTDTHTFDIHVYFAAWY